MVSGLMEVKGQVVSAGGGRVVIQVDRDTDNYPQLYDDAVLECTTPHKPLHSANNIRAKISDIVGDRDEDEVKRIFNYGLNVDRAELDGGHVRLDKWMIFNPIALLNELKRT